MTVGPFDQEAPDTYSKQVFLSCVQELVGRWVQSCGPARDRTLSETAPLLAFVERELIAQSEVYLAWERDQQLAENESSSARPSMPNRTAKLSALIGRDGWLCKYCPKELTPTTVTIDHVVPWSKGGSDELSNLVLACRPCNSSKGARTIEEWQQR